MRILSSLKFTVSCAGSARSSTGGVSSFGPPVGEPRRAHCTNNAQMNSTTKIRLSMVQNNDYFLAYGRMFYA